MKEEKKLFPSVENTILVRVQKKTKLKVQKYLVGKGKSVGEFFTEAAENELTRIKSI